MTPQINRRTLSVGIVLTGVAVVAGTVGAQSRDMQGGVTYEGGKVIPEGQIEIFLEDPANQAKKRLGDQQIRVESNGKSRQIVFSLTRPVSSSASPTLRVVAHLEREDGWLLARGSAQVEGGEPVTITLNTVMY
ncbi:hypothetical protein [uncultured Tateyamaria sp.]|uniref:hypothetical protein n=1 Tax=uncultured Tateyamaria sp. TaxID=455651 RepID=UPI002630627E|nr:hypothetical protein [uncultured Tateyamaria sp.]